MLLVILNVFDVYKRIGRCMNWDVFMFDESSEEGTRSEVAGKDEFRIRRDALPDGEIGEYRKVEDSSTISDSEAIFL